MGRKVTLHQNAGHAEKMSKSSQWIYLFLRSINDLQYDIVRLMSHNVLGCLDSGALQNLGCNRSGEIEMSLKTATSDTELKAIGTTITGLLEHIAVVQNNDLVDNTISLHN